MADENDMDIFDSVISGERNAEPAPSEPAAQEPVRDEQGRFAETPKQEQPVAETTVQPAVVPTPEGVPVAAVQDERRKRQDAERRADELERRLAALEAKPATQTPAQQETPATIWDDPDAFLKGQLNPINGAVSELREMIMESRAEGIYGAEKVAAAKAAAEALKGTPQANALVSELQSKGGNLFSNLVQWHERQQTLETVGNDPMAWAEKLLDNPEFLAKAMAKANGAPVAQNQSNAPIVKLPPSLSRIPASGGNNAVQEVQSDGDVFNSITSARRGK